MSVCLRSNPVFPIKEKLAVEAFEANVQQTLNDPKIKKYHFFWSGGILPPIHDLSFPAAYKIALNDPENTTHIYLWTYNHLDIAEMAGLPLWEEQIDDNGPVMYSDFKKDLALYDPAIFHVAPAHMLIPGRMAGKLIYELNMSLAHLSDVARFIALQKYGGVMMDVDCVLLRPVPKTRFFSTCEPKRRGGVAQSEAYWQKYGFTDLPHPEEWDGRGILCYPVGAPPGDPLIQRVVDSILRKIDAAIRNSNKSFSWGLTTDTMRELVCTDAAARRDVIPPIYTVPYPWWGKPGKKSSIEKGMCFTMCPEYTKTPRVMFGSRIPTTFETIETSWMVSHFFHSCGPDYLKNFRVNDLRSVDTKQKRKTWWNAPNRVVEGSVLHAELLHVFGDSPLNVDVREWRAECPVEHIF